MKILLAIVSMIAVFTADGRNFRNEPGVQNTPNESQLFPDGIEGADSAKPSFNVPGDQNSAEEGQKSPGGPEIQNISDLVYEDYQMKEETKQHERKVKKSSCKAKITCDIVGGFCVNNTKLCSGRLVPEGCKGKCQCCILGTLEAKFDNLEEKYQSLDGKINKSISLLKLELQSLNDDVNSEMKTLKEIVNTSNSALNSDMQSLKGEVATSISNLNPEIQSLKVNLNTSNSNLKLELQFLEGNLNNSNLTLYSELQSLKGNLNISNLNLNSEMQSLKDNVNTSNANMNLKIQSLEENVSKSNSILNLKLNSSTASLNNTLLKLNSELQSLKYYVNTSLSNLNLKLNSSAGNLGPCLGDFFKSAGSNQCFKLLSGIKCSWVDARVKCRDEGLSLAEPSNTVAVTLRKDIVDKYGSGTLVWLDARADSRGNFMWQRGGAELKTDNPLWQPGQPGSRTSTDYCLCLYTTSGGLSGSPQKPYFSCSGCTSYKAYPLCEK